MHNQNSILQQGADVNLQDNQHIEHIMYDLIDNIDENEGLLEVPSESLINVPKSFFNGQTSYAQKTNFK